METNSLVVLNSYWSDGHRNLKTFGKASQTSGSLREASPAQTRISISHDSEIGRDAVSAGGGQKKSMFG